MRAKRIMVIEGDHDTRALLSEVLAEDGYAVTAVASLLDALAATVQGPPDLVLADPRLPRMGGAASVRERLAELGCRPPLILMSTSADAGASAGCADAVIAKPFILEELTAVIARVLATKGG